MGQANEKEDPYILMDCLNLYQHDKQKDNSSEKKFNSLKAILDEYLIYKTALDQLPKKKFGQLRKKTEYHRKKSSDISKLEEMNHKFERINKWIKMAKTPYINNFHLIMHKIRGRSKEKRNSNKDLSFLTSENKIFNKNEKQEINGILITESNKKNRNNNNNEVVIVKKKLKKNRSFDNASILGNTEDFERNAKMSYLDNYTDKIIEKRIISFYKNNISKFAERIFKGPPDSFRWISWCVINDLPLDRDTNIYNNYITKDLEKENKDSIIRDIERTFSDKNMTNDELRKKEVSLYNILKAFWNLDKEVGYCQGMNLIVGFLLLVSEGNELDTFYLLISNFSSSFKERKKFYYSFRGLFCEEFPLLYFFNFIFDILLQENMPEVKKHLDEMGITYDLWIGQWFQTLFTIILPLNWLKRLWDCIYSDNIYFVIKFAIVFTKLIKDDILSKKEEIEIIDYFKEFQKYSLYQENKLLDDKIDINALITRASKIKLDPEEYIKLYKKKGENFDEFSKKMDKNNKISYILQYGNRNINDFKAKHRETVLFQDEKEMKNHFLGEDSLKNEKLKSSNYDPNEKKIKLHISKRSDKGVDILEGKMSIENRNENNKINNKENKRKNNFLDKEKRNSQEKINQNEDYSNNNKNKINIPKCNNKPSLNVNKYLNKKDNKLINNNSNENNYPQSENQKKPNNFFDNNNIRNNNNINQNILNNNQNGNFNLQQNNQAPLNIPPTQLNQDINNTANNNFYRNDLGNNNPNNFANNNYIPNSNNGFNNNNNNNLYNNQNNMKNNNISPNSNNNRANKINNINITNNNIINLNNKQNFKNIVDFYNNANNKNQKNLNKNNLNNQKNLSKNQNNLNNNANNLNNQNNLNLNPNNFYNMNNFNNNQNNYNNNSNNQNNLYNYSKTYNNMNNFNYMNNLNNFNNKNQNTYNNIPNNLNNYQNNFNNIQNINNNIPNTINNNQNNLNNNQNTYLNMNNNTPNNLNNNPNNINNAPNTYNNMNNYNNVQNNFSNNQNNNNNNQINYNIIPNNLNNNQNPYNNQNYNINSNYNNSNNMNFNGNGFNNNINNYNNNINNNNINNVNYNNMNNNFNYQINNQNNNINNMNYNYKNNYMNNNQINNVGVNPYQNQNNFNNN